MQANPKIFWVTPHLRGRGVTVIVEEATHGVTAIADTDIGIGIVCLHDLPEEYSATATVPAVCLNLPRNDQQAAIDGFSRWVNDARPAVLIMNDVAAIEPFWPYIPENIRVIVVLHDHAYGWTRSAIKYAETLDAIVPVSKFVERSVSGKLRHFDGMFRTVENGTSYPVPPKRDAQSGPLKLVFLGAVDRQKGAYDLPAILMECKRQKIACSLTIIGGISDALAANFASVGVSEYVVWVGRLPRKQCFDALAQGDILLMLSRGESFGLVTVEAMSMGCVPIGYSVGGTADIIEDGKSGFLVPLCSYKRVVSAIKRLDGDRALLHSLGAGAMKRSRGRYSSASMAERYWKLIQDVLDLGRASKRRDFTSFRLPIPSSRRYAKVVPAPFRKMIGKIVSLSPKLENGLRKWRGI